MNYGYWRSDAPVVRVLGTHPWLSSCLWAKMRPVCFFRKCYTMVNVDSDIDNTVHLDNANDGKNTDLRFQIHKVFIQQCTDRHQWYTVYWDASGSDNEVSMKWWSFISDVFEIKPPDISIVFDTLLWYKPSKYWHYVECTELILGLHKSLIPLLQVNRSRCGSSSAIGFRSLYIRISIICGW